MKYRGALIKGRYCIQRRLGYRWETYGIYDSHDEMKRRLEQLELKSYKAKYFTNLEFIK